MSRIKLGHEAPIDIFDEVQRVTDYDYALVHLLEQNERYRDTFEAAVLKGREVILDNSIFELEEAFEADRFALWVNRLKPTWYIIPDALEDLLMTKIQASEWKSEYLDKVPGKSIAVVQGKTYEEIVECYKFLDEDIDADMIAISFDYSYYTKSVPHPNKYVSWMLGRVKLLGDLERDGVINKDKPHHLLGVGLPQEGMFYRDKSWIYSMDTSNPIVHALKGIKYHDTGLWSKESQKLHELIDTDLEDIDLPEVLANIYKFNWFWNGKLPLAQS